MATQRYISTSFWDDPWIVSLMPDERYFYLYLLTNPLTNIAGVYQIALRRMVFDTGLKDDRVAEVLKLFEKSKKAYYYQGYIILPSWPKHQKWATHKKIETGINAILSELKPILISYLKNIGYTYPIDRLSIPCVYPSNYSDLDSDLDTDTDTEADSLPAATPLVDNSQEEDIPFDDLMPNRQLTNAWYKAHQEKTAELITPAPEDYKAASDLLKRVELKTALEKIPDYFTCDEWFVKAKNNGKKVWSFAGYCKHFPELLSLTAKGPPKRSALIKTCPVCKAEMPGTMLTCVNCGYSAGDNLDDPENQKFYRDNLERKTKQRVG